MSDCRQGDENRDCLFWAFVNLLFSLCSSVQNSERGKKIGNAMMTTSRSVVQTGKAVGKAAAGFNPDQTVTSQHVINSLGSRV